jgi:SMC interacting uncharacterized protein involved in chromosome segregation
MTDTNYDHIDDLINKKYTLQRDVLASWNELHKMKLKHEALLGALQHIQEEIKCASEPSLFEQLFGELEPNR